MKGAERARVRAGMAGARARELAARRAALAVRAPTGANKAAAAHAAQRVKDAQERAAEARESLRHGFLRSAEAHERAAREFERAAGRGTGDVPAHRRHAAEHRAAAEVDRRHAGEVATPRQALPDTGGRPRSPRRDLLWRRLDHAARRADPSIGRASAVTSAATRMVRGVDAVVVTIRGRRLAQHELAATNRWGHQVEELQYTTGEGPSVAAFATGEPVTVTDLTEYREVWPGFVDAAAGCGVGAAFAFPLAAAAASLGTMTLYRRDPGMPSTGLADVGELAGLLAAELLADGELVERISSSAACEDINVAVGLLSVQQSVSTAEALARLRAAAFAAGLPLTDTAREIVARHLRQHHRQPRE